MREAPVHFSEEREPGQDCWQPAATVLKGEIMALYWSGHLPADRVTALFEEFSYLRNA